MKFLLLGGNGFIGRHLYKFITKIYHKDDIYILDRNFNNNIDADNQFLGDTTDSGLIEKAIKKSNPDFIFYMISNFKLNIEEGLEGIKSNTKNNINILSKFINSKTRIIFLGSSAQYGFVEKNQQPVKEITELSPVSNYGLLKVYEESVFRRFSDKLGLDIVYCRVFNVTGPMEPSRMIGGTIVSQLMKSNYLEIGNLFPKRDFLDVRDIASALVLVGEKGISSEAYNICSGQSISIDNYLKKIIKLMKLNPKIVSSESRKSKNDILDLVGDNTKIKRLGWVKKFSINKSINDLILSYKGGYFD